MTLDWGGWCERKRMIIDAMSTLYFLNDEKDLNENLLQLMKSVPAKVDTMPFINNQLKRLQQVNDGQHTCTKLMMWPIKDTICISSEMKFIVELLKLKYTAEAVLIC